MRHNLWPKIKSAVANYTDPDLVKEDRRKLALLIYDRLDVLGLQAGGKPVPIDVKRLTLLIQERSDTTGSQGSIPPWLPY